MARRGNTSNFWSNFGPFLKIQSGTLDFLDFFVNSRVSPSHSRVSPLRWDRQHTLIPYVLGLGSPIPATQAAPPGIAIPIPIPSHSHPIITHTRDTQSFIPALRAGGKAIWDLLGPIGPLDLSQKVRTHIFSVPKPPIPKHT